MRRKHIIWLLAVVMVVAPLAAVAPSPKVAHADCWSASESRWYPEGGQSAKAVQQGLACSGGQWRAGGGYQTAQAQTQATAETTMAAAPTQLGCQSARVADSAPFWAKPGRWVEVRRNPGYPNSSWAPWINCQTGAGYYSEHLLFGSESSAPPTLAPGSAAPAAPAPRVERPVVYTTGYHFDMLQDAEDWVRRHAPTGLTIISISGLGYFLVKSAAARAVGMELVTVIVGGVTGALMLIVNLVAAYPIATMVIAGLTFIALAAVASR